MRFRTAGPSSQLLRRAWGESCERGWESRSACAWHFCARAKRPRLGNRSRGVLGPDFAIELSRLLVRFLALRISDCIAYTQTSSPRTLPRSGWCRSSACARRDALPRTCVFTAGGATHFCTAFWNPSGRQKPRDFTQREYSTCEALRSKLDLATCAAASRFRPAVLASPAGDGCRGDGGD